MRCDIRQAAAWSEEKFGASTADRYSLPIRQALPDVLEEATRPVAKARADLAPHAFVDHLMFSRERVAGERVKAPRHFVLYRHMGEKVEFARLLHENRDSYRHLPLTV